VILPEGGRYEVTTGTVTWTALGTAFDLDRTGPSSTGGDVVHELSIEHSVVADGPGLQVTIDEGRGASLRLGDAPIVTTTVVDPVTAAADGWVHLNAALDRADGLPLGSLEGIELDGATPNPVIPIVTSAPPTAAASSPAAASASPEPTPEPTAAPTASPTPKPTPRTTPKPTPQPTPTFGTMTIAALACPGGVVLGW